MNDIIYGDTRVEVPGMGHNHPPTPLDELSGHAADLYDEAKGWLDGTAIATQGQADGVAKLLDLARAASKDADAKRKAETKPLDDQKKEIMDAWRPVTERLGLIETACKKTLAVWLSKIEQEKHAAREAARKAAEEASRKADEATRAAADDDIEAQAEAARLRDEAAHREAQAAKAAKDGAKADGGGKRAVHLRSVWTATMADPTTALRWCWQDPVGHEALVATAQKIAEQAVRDGKRDIPGFEITEHKEAV